MVSDSYRFSSNFEDNLDIFAFYVHIVLITLCWYFDCILLFYLLCFWLIAVIFLLIFLGHNIRRTGCFNPKFDSILSIYNCFIVVPFTWFAFYKLLFRIITFRFRKFPDFYILGEQKCGTTTLSHYLTDTKLNKFFNKPFSCLTSHVTKNKDTHYKVGVLSYQRLYYQLYRSCFSLNLVNNNKLDFDASPFGLFLPYIRDFIYNIHLSNNTLNKVKFIVIVRDPIKRFQSHMNAERMILASAMKFGMIRSIPVLNRLASLDEEPIKPDDEKGKERENEKIDSIVNSCIDFNLSDPYLKCYESMKSRYDKCNNNRNKNPMDLEFYDVSMLNRCGLVTHGYYYENIKWYLKKFDKSQFLFLEINDLKSDKVQSTIIKMLKFLDMYDNHQDECNGIIFDKKFDCNKHLNATSLKKNVKLSNKIINRLKAIFKPQNEKLYQLIDREFDWQ